MSRATGTFKTSSVAGEQIRTFVPFPLPPNPPLSFNEQDYDLMEQANRALGRLDGIMLILPNPALFLYFYVRKEALLSSQIEGTQSSFADILLFENDDVPTASMDDIGEVSNYVAAMEYGLKRIREGFPLSNRLLREIHEVLLADGRGSERNPGEFRRSQNWIGGSRPGNAKYVPPPPEDIPECMGALEKFLHDDPIRTPLLIKAALAHVQLETIHPFLDGNGRLGRLLITLLFCSEKALTQPILYLSLYLKNNRDEYYELLQRVRTNGTWEEWIGFFLRGVLETSQQAYESAQAIMKLFNDDRARITAELGRAASSALRLHEALQRTPLARTPRLADQLALSHPTVASALQNLQNLGIVHEVTGRSRDRLFSYTAYLDILDQGTQPLPR